jgi:hypothetical protein
MKVNEENAVITCLFLGESSVLADVVPKISTREQVHDKVKVLSVLEGVVHIDNEGVVKLRKDLPLIHHTLD